MTRLGIAGSGLDDTSERTLDAGADTDRLTRCGGFMTDEEIIISPIREVSDGDASKEIQSIIMEKGGDMSIAEVAEITCFPFVQIERIVDAWS